MDTALAEPMAKKKPDETPPTGDRFLLSLPTEYWHLLRAICKADHRNMTTETQIALEARARKLGLKFRPNYPDGI
jgi:hypothetical protein